MRILYQIGLGIALLLAAPFLLSTRRRHYWRTLRGRLGRDVPIDSQGALWFHAVSVGEAMVAASVIRALPPQIPVLLTTITPTGQDRARAMVGDRATVAYLPFDLGWTLDPFLTTLQPRALVLVEGDYWPLLLSRVTSRGLPTAAINSRIGDTTYSRLSRYPWAVPRLMGRVETFGVQSVADKGRLEGLGIAEDRVQVTGNLKYEAVAPQLSTELEDLITRLSQGRPAIVCGSTMPGEDELLLDAYREIGGRRSAFLILAPRHPERWEAVASLVRSQGLSLVRRSESVGLAGDVLLLDSLGELAGLYEMASIAFIGGTLSGTGGHNPLEPARFAVPITVGPSMENFRDMASEFDRSEAWGRVSDRRSLAETWNRWLAEPSLAQAIGARAAALVEENQGALGRTLDLLGPILALFPETESPLESTRDSPSTDGEIG